MASMTDMKKAVAYLEDAAKLYEQMPKPKHRWRARLIRKLTAKLTLEINKQRTNI